jgi:DNA primase large subunit
VEYAYGLRGSRRDWLMPGCRWMRQRGLCLECGWDRNPATYTYARAQVPEEVRQRFFQRARSVVGALILEG